MRYVDFEVNTLPLHISHVQVSVPVPERFVTLIPLLDDEIGLSITRTGTNPSPFAWQRKCSCRASFEGSFSLHNTHVKFSFFPCDDDDDDNEEGGGGGGGSGDGDGGDG